MAIPLTENGYVRLLNQLGYYESKAEMILQDSVSSAHLSMVDSSSTLSPELEEKRQRLVVLNESIRTIRRILANHYLIILPEPKEGEITVGSVVTLANPDGTEFDVLLTDLMPIANEDFYIPFKGVQLTSINSALGKALFDHENLENNAKAGDEITVVAPSGQTNLTVIEVYTPTLKAVETKTRRLK